MKLKKALSLTLALALSLAMAVPAFAAPVELVSPNAYLGLKLSDAVSTEVVQGVTKNSDSGSTNLYTVKQGTTVTVLSIFRRAELRSDGTYAAAANGASFEVGLFGEDGVPQMVDMAPVMGTVTFGPEHAGLWQFTALDTYFYINVLPDDSAAPEQPAQPEQPSVPATAGTYTVKAGDTWSSICINFYGSNAQRTALQRANKGVKFQAGAVVTLPDKLGNVARIPAPSAGAGEKLYTVQAGDTLGKIAAAEYGQTALYKAIFERNADRLKNANTIYEGQVIVLPAKQ